METDRVFDHIVKDHNLVNGGIEEGRFTCYKYYLNIYIVLTYDHACSWLFYSYKSLLTNARRIIKPTFSELQIAAKLGQELLHQNDAIRERNRLLWQSNEEKAREIEMLRQQNKLLRADSESKAADQVGF